MHIGIKML